MPSRVPLSQGDVEAAPAREVAFYGGVRQGFEQARAGMEAVIQHLTGLYQKDPNNVRLERYLAQLNKLLAKMHKLQMRSSRVRDRTVERKQPKQPGGSWHEFGKHPEPTSPFQRFEQESDPAEREYIQEEDYRRRNR